MTNTPSRRAVALATSLVLGAAGSLSLLLASPAGAAPAPVPLGSADAFAVLGASTVTNTGPSVVRGDLGLSPGTSVTGFPPGLVIGTQHVADTVAALAQDDTTIAYDNAAGRSPQFTVPGGILTGQTLVPGVYSGGTLSLAANGSVTLDGGNDPDAVFILRSADTLITGSNSSVVLIRGAQACNVFWQVTSSATLGTDTSFQGTIAAMQSITATTGASVSGRLLARNGAVTLDTNAVTRPTCLVAAPPSATPTATVGTTPVVSASPSVTPTPSASAVPSVSASAVPSASASVTPSTAVTPSASAVATAVSPAPVAPRGTPVPGVDVPTDTTGGSLGGPPTTAVPQLPRTGADTGTAGLLGLGALLAGVLLVLAAHEPVRGRHARPRSWMLLS